MTTACTPDYQTRLGLSYAPSSYQADIFDWIESGRGHAVVEAVAGSGKTTTIVSAARLITGDGLFVAFNKSIADLLGEKLAGTAMKASTVHSHGFACVRYHGSKRARVNASKYRDMVRGAREAAEARGSICGEKLTREQRETIEDEGFPTRACEKLIDLARLSLLDMDGVDFGDDLLDLAERHDLADFAECLDDVVITVVRRCMQMGADTWGEVDYTDMIWLPVINGWRPRQYSWVFVDECQDISAAALELIKRSVRRGGRMLFVGDRRQAIYGFAGADAESFANIIDDLDATVLPLSVCYRCPTSALEIARQWCPQIEARKDAPAGVVRRAKPADYVSEAREGDLVLCRRNAPLLGLCFELIAEGVPAVVRGRDIAAGLAKIVTKITKGRPWSDFGAALDAWENKQAEAVASRCKDKDRAAERVDQIRDQAEALRIVATRSEAKSAEDLAAAIEDLFSDERGSVVLSSIHRAKGLESERVAILEADKLPRPARQDWQVEQEENLAYVAYTRAERELVELVA